MALAGRLFPGEIAFDVQIQEMAHRRFVMLIATSLSRILSVQNIRAEPDGFGPRLLDDKMPYGPSVMRRTRPRIRFSSTKAFVCGVTRGANPATLSSRTKIWPDGGNGVASTRRLVSFGM